ncbi:MAG: type II toxin-antitoxin system VapC family toxin [Acidimicrobiia bacterium]
MVRKVRLRRGPVGPHRRPSGQGVRPIALLLDTGPIYAAANGRDRDHARCADLIRSAAPPLVVPALVVAEVSYLVGTYLGPDADAEFFRMLTSSRFRVEPVTRDDARRVAELVGQYADLPLGGIDASVVAVAERLGLDTVATLDRRDFTVVRPAHVDAFTLVP